MAMRWLWPSLLGCILAASAYIPASPSNNTAALISNSEDFVQLTFQPPGSSQSVIFKDVVSRQLVTDQTNASIVGVNYGQRGALVHFTETNATTQPVVAVPWVALVRCDVNETGYSLDNDIFTMSRDLGATAALLYSLTSQACIINEDYLANFQQPLDVYTTTSLQTARLIENQFSSVSSWSYWYDSALLNSSATPIWTALNDTEVVITPSSVISALSSYSDYVYSLQQAAGNDSVTTTDSDGNTITTTLGWMPTMTQDAGNVGGPTLGSDGNATDLATVTPTNTGMRKRQTASTTVPAASATPTAVSYLIAVVGNAAANYAPANATASAAAGTTASTGMTTSLAMIVLYAITGCITFCFIVVVLSGAIRALRHPERYGPRAGGVDGQPAQSRAGGISRAILDSIPLVRYTRGTDAAAAASPAGSDVAYKPPEDIEMGERRQSIESTQEIDLDEDGAAVVGTLARTAGSPRATRRESTLSKASSADHYDLSPLLAKQAVPAERNDEQSCPICLVPFEEGDDLRILPCDRRHCFHQECIDPWLLEVSKLCPLCRWDVTTKRESSIDPAAAFTDEPLAEDEDRDDAHGASSRFRRAFSGHHLREATSSSTGSAAYSTRFARYLAQVRAAAHSAGAVGRRRSARWAAAAVVAEPSHSPPLMDMHSPSSEEAPVEEH